jgi:hypothetical protein
MFDHRRGLHRIVKVFLEGSICRGCMISVTEPVVLHASSVLNLSNRSHKRESHGIHHAMHRIDHGGGGRSDSLTLVSVWTMIGCLSFTVNLNRNLLGSVTHNCIPETYELPLGDVQETKQ